jgi:hypothetical protein
MYLSFFVLPAGFFSEISMDILLCQNQYFNLFYLVYVYGHKG